MSRVFIPKVLQKSKISLFAIATMCLLLVPTIHAQKFVKHKVKYPTKFVWYEALYPDGSVGVCMENKKNIIVPKERGFSNVEYEQGRFKVKKGDYVGVFDMSGNEIITPDKFNSIKYDYQYVYPDYYRYYKVGIGGSEYSPEHVGIYDFTGKEIIPCTYKSIDVGDVSIYIQGNSKKAFYFNVTKQDSITGNLLNGICDTTGAMLFPLSDYGWIYPQLTNRPTSYDLSPNIIGYKVTKGGKQGACDKSGEELLAPAYERLMINDEQGRLLFYFKQDGKEGIADMRGNVLIAPKYDNIYICNDDGHCYFKVELGGKQGICDATGVEIIPPVIEGTIFRSFGEYKTERGNQYVTIDPSDFVNPAQKIVMLGDYKVLADVNGTYSIRAYDVLEWDEESGKYVGSLQGYTTFIDMLGKEEISIAKQIFDEAYGLPDDNIYDKMALYNMLIEVDGNNKEGYQASALNNIGVMYHNNGDEDTALNFYDKASAMGNSTASENAEKIRKARRTAARAERMQRISEALGQINNALSSFSSTTQYSGYSNSSSNQAGMTGSSGKGGNASARQSAYDHMANRAASLYRNLTDKNGYVGSTRTRSVDVSTYNSLRRKMRNYRVNAQRDGITLQKSQYEDLSL